MTDEQQRILSKIIQAEEYFLLWGPPGTGKTSIVLRHLVAYLLSETQEQLLLLAFTNRAVDEICEALDRIGGSIREHYFRIGSSYATAPKYQSQLLQEKMKGIGSRRDLQKILKGHRIVVGTVAAVVGKDELLQLKQFDRVIIDEASQILEPLLVGLLSHFKRFVLIGDHKQLPAVVTQSPEDSAVPGGELHSMGLGNLRNSLFERLFKKCQAQGWDWALDKLSHQGRMHRDIMRFPSEHFYGGNLNILPDTIPAHLRQMDQYPLQPNEHPLAGLLCSKRMIFLPTPIDDGSPAQKTNRHEAQMVADLVANFQALYDFNQKPFSSESIGIITPYRAQIAQIKTALQQRDLPSESITVDTVERYQGGARDIILISLCTNSSFQLLSLASLSDEGVDRKLNVALTRAREQVILLGNPNILRQNPVYAALIEFCEQS
ncbi:MAG: AAA family ATPase [Cyanothece sp. SIO1E1]|nr:AAA family ATPase [Cyanothece sp. SIO1E1]